MSKPIASCAPHAPPPLYTTLSLSRLPPSMALPPLSVHDPHGAASTHGPFTVVAGPCPHHHGWPLPMPPRLAPVRATTAGPCPRRHSWPLPTPPRVAPAHATMGGPCLCCHGWSLPAPPQLVPARATTAGPCLGRHGWPLSAPPQLPSSFTLPPLPSTFACCTCPPWCRYHIPPLSRLIAVSRPFLILYILHKLCAIQVFLS